METDIKTDFPRLVDEYQDALYRFGLRLCGNSQDAEEIAQEAFVRAYRWLAGHRPEEGFQMRPWLYRVALNVFRNRVRKPALATIAVDAANVVAGAEEPDLAAEAAETRQELAEKLAELPLRYREAIVLRHIEDLSYPDIAAVLKRPEGTIKSDVHRGLALLREALVSRHEEVLV